MAAVDPHPVGPATARAGQALGVQPRDQFGVASVLVQQVGDREVHRYLTPSTRGRTSPSISQLERACKLPRHQLADMSQTLLIILRSLASLDLLISLIPGRM